MRLRKKAFLYAGVSLLILIIPLTLFSLQTVSQGVDMVRQERLALIKEISLDLDEVINHLRAEILRTAVILGQRWQDNPGYFQKEQLASLQDHLKRHLTSFDETGQHIFVAMLDAEGTLLWTEPYLAGMESQSFADTTAVREVIERGQIYIDTEDGLIIRGSPSLSLLVPIEDGQEMMKGILIADLPDFPIQIGFTVLNRRGGDDYVWELITRSGLVLASPVPGQVGKKSPHWEAIRFLAQEWSSGIEEHSIGGKDHMIAFSPLERVPWGVVLEQPEEKTLEILWVMGRRLLIVSVLAISVAAGLTWVFSRQIISPLQRLAATAQRFGAGDLDAQVPDIGKDEIGELARTLDTMRHQLKHSLNEIRDWNQELGQRVKQRTKELEELYQQLQERDGERRDLLGKIITAQEEERRRIARELHDEVSQTLTALVMSLGSVETLLDSDPTTAKQRLGSLRALTSEAIEEVRRLMQDLRPSLLDDLGLVAAISWYTENYLTTIGVKTELETQGFDRRLPPTVEITLFRVVQEAITNIVKHAQAKTARIHLQITSSAIVGSIKDDGVGFNVDTMHHQRGKGVAVGLLGMEERVSLLEGKLNIESQPGEGTRVYFEIPWQEENGKKDTRSHS